MSPVLYQLSYRDTSVKGSSYAIIRIAHAYRSVFLKIVRFFAMTNCQNNQDFYDFTVDLDENTIIPYAKAVAAKRRISEPFCE